jgi:hypothetical protein
VLYGTRHRQETFFIAQPGGTNVSQLIQNLHRAGVGEVTVEADRKMTPEVVEHFLRAMESANIRVKEFWIPSSTDFRGEVDLMSRHP